MPERPAPRSFQELSVSPFSEDAAAERELPEPELAEQEKISALISDVALCLIQSGTLDSILDCTVRFIVKHLDVAFARVWTLNKDTQILELRASAGLYTHLDGPHSRVPVGKYKIGLIAQEQKAHVTNDVFNDTRVSDQEWARREGMVAFAGYPLIVDGETVGVIALFSRHALTDVVHAALSSLAYNVALGIERKFVEAQTHEQTEMLEILYRIGQTLSVELDLKRLVQAVTDAATEITGAEFGSFFYNVYNQEGESYLLYTLSGVPAEKFADFPMPRATDLFGPTFRGEGTIRCNDVRQDARYGNNEPHYGMPEGHLPVVSYLAVPVISRSGEVLGGLFFGHQKADVFTVRVERIVEGLAAQAAIAMDNAMLFEALHRERDKAEAIAHENQRLYEEARRTSRLKDEFLATLSHELRSPLNAILGWSQILREHDNIDENTFKSGLATIGRNAQAQSQLIEDMLDVSRILTGKLRLELRPIEMCDILENAIHTVAPAAQAKNITLEARLDRNAGLVSGDPDRVMQIAWNLLSNAIKFTPKNGSVTVELVREESQARVSVSDTGQGIEPEFLPYVFDRFSQADASSTRNAGGLGIGLGLVKHLTELHGGSVAVASEGVGKGASFSVYFPLMSVRPEKVEIKIPAPSEAPVILPLEGAGKNSPDIVLPVLSNLRILVVDDENDARTLTALALQRQEAHVDSASSAEEALVMIQERRQAQQPYDVLVSDIGMPDINGYDLIRRVRNSEIDPQNFLPAIALTAYASSKDRMQTLLAGFQIHTSKPVDPDELVALVASLTGRTGRN